MNERIEAYLKQHYCRDYFNRYGEMVEDGHYFMYRKEVDGLIELIVRECADVAKETRWAVPPSQEQIARGIQQHFGVGE